MPPKRQPLMDEETVIFSVYGTGSGRKRHLGIIAAFPPHLSEFEKRRVRKIITREDFTSHSIVNAVELSEAGRERIVATLSTTSGRIREIDTLKIHLAHVLGCEAVTTHIDKARFTALTELPQFVLVEYGPASQR